MDEAVDYKLYLSLAHSVSTGNVREITRFVSSVPLATYAVSSKANVLSLLLVLLPNSINPGELVFIKDIIYGSEVKAQESGINVDEVCAKVADLYGVSDPEILEQEANVLISFIDQQAEAYKWDKGLLNNGNDTPQDRNFVLFSFVKARTLKVSMFHNENVFFNEELFQLVPASYELFDSWKHGFLEPLNFTINHRLQQGIAAHEPLPNVVQFQNYLRSKENFHYLIKHMDSTNVNDFLVHSIVPYTKHNHSWHLLNQWVSEKIFLSVDDYALALRMFEFFFNRLITVEQDAEFLQFLDQLVRDYLYKVYSCNLLTDETLEIISETLQNCIVNHDYFKKTKEEEHTINFEKATIDHSIIDDEYIKANFCNNNILCLTYLSSMVDSVSKLIKITNNNESLMSVTQVLLISISTTEVQLNFAKLLIHNHKINSTEFALMDEVGSSIYNSWDNFLNNFNWLIESSVLFKKIQNYECINKINETLFEILLTLNFNELISKYLLVNFNSNANLKKILLKHCWYHFTRAQNFSLAKDELLVVAGFLKNFDLDFDNQIRRANDFFVTYRNNLDIYSSADEAKFVDFDTSLVNNKPLTTFVSSTNFSLAEIHNTTRDFELSDDLNFEILKFKKLLIVANQIVINYKFAVLNPSGEHGDVVPVDIYRINNPLFIMEKILELNGKSYADMSKLYKIVVDSCIAMDKVGLIYDVSSYEKGSGVAENVFEDFDNFEEHEEVFTGKPRRKQNKEKTHDGGQDFGSYPDESSRAASPQVVHKFPLKDKLIASCINSALIDSNFEFAYEHSMRLLNNETGTSLESLQNIWLSIFQVCKYIDPGWLAAPRSASPFYNEGDDRNFLDENGAPDDHIDVPLDILTQQIEVISKLLAVVPSSTGISATENKIILGQADYLIGKYHRKLNARVVRDFAERTSVLGY